MSSFYRQTVLVLSVYKSSCRLIVSLLLVLASGADLGFLLGGGTLLRNDVTDRLGKQILKVNAKKKVSSHWGRVGGGGGGGGVRTLCTLPVDPPLRLAPRVFLPSQNQHSNLTSIEASEG